MDYGLFGGFIVWHIGLLRIMAVMNFMFPLILIMCRGDSVWKINIGEAWVKCDEEGGYSMPFE